MKYFKLSLLSVSFAALMLSACESQINVHGNLPDPEDIQTVLKGDKTKHEVQQILGSPSSISTFQDNTWYYIGQKVEQFAFLDPEVVERSILVLKFDDNQDMASAQLLTVEDGRLIDPVSRKTPTLGKELTVIQQILGNLGKFNTPAPQ